MDVYERADQFRDELLRRERAAASELVRAYGRAWERLQVLVERLDRRMAAAAARGEQVTPFWLFERDRLQSLLDQVEREIGRVAGQADAAIRAEQANAVQAAQDHAERLARDAAGTGPPGAELSWSRLPSGAVEQLVGTLADGSPLRELLDRLGPNASARVRDALVTGLVTGRGVRRTAGLVRDALGGNLARALTIARTETLRAYREASRRSYAANADVVEGWVWHSARGVRTCALCWAMHGRLFPLSERMATHANCRCAMLPRTRSWEELGFPGVPDTRPPIENGPFLFDRLSTDEQRVILGPRKLAAWQAGQLRLQDLVGLREDQRWGWVAYERSLADVVMRGSPHLPPRPALPPNSRHRLAAVRQNTYIDDWNTVVESRVWDAIEADVDAVNQGNAIRRGDVYVVHGRTYRLEGSGRLSPRDGIGFHRLDRAAFRALGVYNAIEDRARAEAILDRMRTTTEAREQARRAWESERRTR